MEFIEKHKALIITTLLMGIFILSLYNINMIAKQQEQAEILMEIPEELIEQLTKEEEEEPEPEEEAIPDDAERTHESFNEDFEDHDEIEKRIKSLTETQEPEPAEEEPEDDRPALENIEEKKPKPEKEETNSRYSSSSWSLKGRELREKIPNPVYTCEGSGKVVVKIEVNQNGYVTDTKIDKRKSTTRNECLFDNAMLYARRALFSRSSKSKQEGTITYFFNYRR